MPHDANLDSLDIEVHDCGYDVCPPNGSCEQIVGDDFLFVYVKSGNGSARIDDTTYLLGTKTSLFIFPGSDCFLCADTQNPWEYIWIAFGGRRAGTFLQHAFIPASLPIHRHKDSETIEMILRQMLVPQHNGALHRSLYLTGLAHLVLASIIKETGLPGDSAPTADDLDNRHIHDAIQFMTTNYTQNIGVDAVAEYVGLDRCYFSKLFKSHLRKSPKRFLVDYRIGKASTLLSRTDMTVEEIARATGHESPNYFSRVFKRCVGVSPSEFRKKKRASMTACLPVPFDDVPSGCSFYPRSVPQMASTGDS